MRSPDETRRNKRFVVFVSAGVGRRKQVRVAEKPDKPAEPSLREMARRDLLCLELGHSLVPLVQPEHGKKLVDRVTSVRRHIARELGMILPAVRFRDNITLEADEYIIRVHGREVARGSAQLGRLLAVGPLEKLKELDGVATVDPTYGMPAVWIEAAQRKDAERLEMLIFDCVSVIATQFTETARVHASAIFTLADCVTLLKAHDDTKLISEELLQRGMDSVIIWQVLRNLLAERVSIGNLLVILHTLLDQSALIYYGQPYKLYNSTNLTELVREALAEEIFAELRPQKSQAALVWWLPKELEAQLLDKPGAPLDGLLEKTGLAVKASQEAGMQPIIVCSPAVRPLMRQATRAHFPCVAVLSQAEIPAGAPLARLTV